MAPEPHTDGEVFSGIPNAICVAETKSYKRRWGRRHALHARLYLAFLRTAAWDSNATLHDLVVLTQPLGAGMLDAMYGNLGQALVALFRSYTVDLRDMQLCPGELRDHVQ